jgi:phosphoserine phosphatase
MGSLGGMTQAPLGKVLYVFDFDHTIVDQNSDIFIYRALPGGILPDHIKESYVTGKWTEYMQRVFEHMHMLKVSQAETQVGRSTTNQSWEHDVLA